MLSSIRTPEDAVNAALVRIGYKLRIGNLFDGSAASVAALTIYSQTRDELLREEDWGFAERDAPLTLIKTAPTGGYIPPLVWSSTYPILPWIYEYEYVSDCLKVRALRETPIFIPEFDPKPVVYRIANDNSLQPPAKVILCNIADAVCVYTAMVTDPTTWEASFAEGLIASLARRLAPGLSNIETAKVEAADEQAAVTLASMKIG